MGQREAMFCQHKGLSCLKLQWKRVFIVRLVKESKVVWLLFGI